MTTPSSARPLWFASPDDFRRARDVLEQAQFNSAGVIQTLNVSDLSIREGDAPLILHRTRGAAPRDSLIRLFLVNVPVPIALARQAVAPMSLESWVQAGLLQVDGEQVSATVKLQPFQNMVLAFDLWTSRRSPMREDYVMGIGRSSTSLASMTVRRPSVRTLDLGAGCGIQAFMAAPHSQRVLAVDRNPRAVMIAEFNAQFNGFANVECRQGDLFEPVRGEKFDLVISNPPFVISPRARYIFRDSGMHGDQITERIVREVPALLNEGGYCEILCNWAHVGGQDTKARLASWFEGSGCNAWVMSSETRDSGIYAATWIRHTEVEEPEQVAAKFAEWMAYYEAEKIEAMSAGIIILRRATRAKNWLRFDDAPGPPIGECGPSVHHAFEARDYLENLPDLAALLDGVLRTSPDLRMDQQCETTDGRWAITSSTLRMVRGLAYAGGADAYVAMLIAGSDGRRPLRETLQSIATAMETDVDHLAPRVLPMIRDMIERGFLIPRELESPAAAAPEPARNTVPGAE